MATGIVQPGLFVTQLNFLLFSWTSESTAGPKPSHEYTVSITAPDASLVTEGAFICTSVPIANASDPSFIVKIRPNPIPGASYQMFLRACEEPGLQTKSGFWDCGQFYDAVRVPSLARGTECGLNTNDIPYSFFNYEFDGAATGDKTMILPPDTGIPVAGKTGLLSLVLTFHFLYQKNTSSKETNQSAVDVTLTKTPVKHMVRSLVIEAYGFVAGHSVGRVAGSWTLKQDIRMHFLLMSTVSLAKCIHINVWIDKKDKHTIQIMDRDPGKEGGISQVDPILVMQKGDRLRIECMFNNTLSSTLPVIYEDMCILNLAFTVEGNKEPETQLVFSKDMRYSRCFSEVQSPGVEINSEEETDFQGNITADECFHKL